MAICNGMQMTVLALALLLVAQPASAGLYSEHVMQLDNRNFDQLVMESADTFIVKFMAPWCGHVRPLVSALQS